MPRAQGHGILSLPAVKNTVQRPDAIVREKGGGGCSVVLILVAGDRKEKKEEAMLRVYKVVI